MQRINAVLNLDHIIWQNQDQLLLSWILSSIIEVVMAQVAGCKTIYEAWNALEKMYLSQSTARIMQMRLQLQDAKKGLSSMIDYFAKDKTIADTLAATMNLVSELDLILSILSCLGPQYNSFVVSITTAHRAFLFLKILQVCFSCMNLELSSNILYEFSANTASHNNHSTNGQGSGFQKEKMGNQTILSVNLLKITALDNNLIKHNSQEAATLNIDFTTNQKFNAKFV